MDGDFGAKLRRILGDAEAMEKISAIASGLQKNDPAAQPDAPPTAASAPVPAPVRDDRAAFLAALKPLLKEEKQKKIDDLQTALTVAAMIGHYKKHKTE